MAYKASFDGGAAAVLFTGGDAAKVPVTAGPRDIAGDFTTPAFSCVHSPAFSAPHVTVGNSKYQFYTFLDITSFVLRKQTCSCCWVQAASVIAVELLMVCGSGCGFLCCSVSCDVS